MATFLRTAVATNIGTTPVDVLTAGSSARFTVIGCNLANKVDENITIDVFVIDASNVEGVYIKGLIVPLNSSIKLITNGEKLVLSENCRLRIVSDVASSVDAIISYAEIS